MTGRLAALWEDLTGQKLRVADLRQLETWVRQFGFEVVVKSMHDAAGGKKRSIGHVGQIAAVRHADELRPGTRQCYRIRGILVARFPDENRDRLLKSLLEARAVGAPLDEITRAANQADTIVDFRNELGRIMAAAASAGV